MKDHLSILVNLKFVLQFLAYCEKSILLFISFQYYDNIIIFSDVMAEIYHADHTSWLQLSAFYNYIYIYIIQIGWYFFQSYYLVHCQLTEVISWHCDCHLILSVKSNSTEVWSITCVELFRWVSFLTSLTDDHISLWTFTPCLSQNGKHRSTVFFFSFRVSTRGSGTISKLNSYLKGSENTLTAPLLFRSK